MNNLELEFDFTKNTQINKKIKIKNIISAFLSSILICTSLFLVNDNKINEMSKKRYSEYIIINNSVDNVFYKEINNFKELKETISYVNILDTIDSPIANYYKSEYFFRLKKYEYNSKSNYQINELIYLMSSKSKNKLNCNLYYCNLYLKHEKEQDEVYEKMYLQNMKILKNENLFKEYLQIINNKENYEQRMKSFYLKVNSINE